MATRKSMAHILAEAAIHPSPTSSPLRRKSILPQSSASSVISENDDDAERRARRREINVTTTPVTTTSTDGHRRRSLGLTLLGQMPAAQMAERISQCIKLGTENKINLKNAFSLEMIDFMVYMIKKQDTNMTNLQVASTSLDVSTKIYGFRVDGVHMEILKMIGGLDKQDINNQNGNGAEQMDVEGEHNEHQSRSQAMKRRKKNKQRIFSTPEALRTNVATEKPSLITMEADSQTTDMLYQATLPNHANSRFYQHQYNDVLVDTIECEDIQDRDAGCCIPSVGEFSQMQICPPVFYFDFQSWNEDDIAEVEPEENDDGGFQFDLDASLPRDDEPAPTRLCSFDIDDVEEHVNRFVNVSNQVENIVDFYQVVATSAPERVSEYSFVHKNLNIHWAGPSHWKATNLRKILGNSRVVETCRQAAVKKKKEVELCFDGETVGSVDAKFLSSRTAKLQARTAKVEWNEEMITLPPDEHYDITLANKLYRHPKKLNHHANANEMNTTHLSEIGEDYNYENENDTSNYCPGTSNGECSENVVNENCIRSDDECVVESQIPFTGDNLVALPKLTNKLSIAFSVRAKKIDMRQLKKSIWKCLNTDSDERTETVQSATNETAQQNVNTNMSGSKRFSDVYKMLPTKLTKMNAEALSFPISFVSLLHLANEKTLKVTSPSDMSDLIVEQG
ncbi:condensin complex subunit 2 [Andrena cerasifolii]|uniref:condensin complex subunit 2 n=1 Tax=Andrena cerasifolii TaxID=2819439 RepID=UPI004037B606